MNKENAIFYLKTLLRIDSVETASEQGAPFGKGVNDCLLTALDMLNNEGFSVKNGDGYYGYGEMGEGELFGILTHLDVVPVGKGWTKPPFGAVEQDGKIYARGALDDKGPFVACLWAFTRLLEEGRKPTKRVRFILGCDEESGWECMDKYVEQEEMPLLGFSPDGDFPVINCEKGIVYHAISYPKPKFIEYITSGERANVVPDYATAKVLKSSGISVKADKDVAIFDDGDSVIVTTKGVSCHGSHPENGKNALTKLLEILSSISDECKELYNAFSDNNGKGINLEISDEKSGKLTLNLGTAKTENGEIRFELDVRHPVDYQKEYVTARLKENLTGKVEETFFHLPLYVDKEHDLVKALLSAYNKVTGENAQPISIGGGTYARVLPVGVAFGPSFPSSQADIHCADEYIDVEEFEKSAEIYYEALKTLCF